MLFLIIFPLRRKVNERKTGQKICKTGKEKSEKDYQGIYEGFKGAPVKRQVTGCLGNNQGEVMDCERCNVCGGKIVSCYLNSQYETRFCVDCLNVVEKVRIKKPSMWRDGGNGCYRNKSLRGDHGYLHPQTERIMR